MKTILVMKEMAMVVMTSWITPIVVIAIMLIFGPGRALLDSMEQQRNNDAYHACMQSDVNFECHKIFGKEILAEREGFESA